MLDTWNESIFSNIKNRLQDSAMKLVHAERLGEAFDSQLVIGVRESYGEQNNTVSFSWDRKVPNEHDCGVCIQYQRMISKSRCQIG